MKKEQIEAHLAALKDQNIPYRQIAFATRVAETARLEETDRDLILALATVARENFVDARLKNLAYWDKPLQINEHSSASQPSLVAEMISALRLLPTDTVLEIGTAYGYTAAILSKCVKEVFTAEIDEELAHSAIERLQKENIENVHVLAGDGLEVIPEGMMFDAIIIKAAMREIPESLILHLAENGRIVAPVGEDPDNCVIRVGHKFNGEMEWSEFGSVTFVPLKSNTFPSVGW
jgi:protein-L-isoaspartate(D-aspartate) O-methyltransferase